MMNLQEMKVKELREKAAELNITGRWDMNKPQLIEAIEKATPQEVEVQEVQTQEETVEVNLTAKEIKLLNGMRQNEYNDAIEYPTWLFTAVDNSGIDEKKARGVISSLIKKDLVYVDAGHLGDEQSTISFTDEGKKLFENADGEECSWGGPRLLKEIEEVEQFERVTNTVEFQEIAKRSASIIDTFIKEGKRGTKGKSTEITFDGETHVFKRTYEASKFLAEKLECKYSTVDRYLVGKLKGREVKFPKALAGTPLETMTCKYI